MQQQGVVIDISKGTNFEDTAAIDTLENYSDDLLNLNSSKEIITLITSMQNGDLSSQKKLEEMIINNEELFNKGDIPIALSSQYIKSNQIDKAVELLNRVPVTPTTQGRILIRKGIIESVLGDSEKAIEYYLESLNFQPNSFVGNYNLGTLYLKNRNYKSAILYLNSATSLAGGDKKSRALANLGISYSKLDKYRESEDAYIESINLNPSTTSTRLNLAKLYIDNDNLDLGEKQLKDVLKLDKNSITALLTLSDLNSRRGNITDSLRYINSALKVNPRDSRALVAQGLHYFHLEDIKNAYNSFSKVASGLDDSLAARFNLGKISFENRNLKEAETHYLRSIELSNNRHYESMNNLGLVYKEMENFNKAIEYYNLAYETDNSYYNSLYNLGLLYIDTEDYLLAQSAFRRSLNIDSSNANAWYNLGITQVKLGEINLAIESYKRVIIIDPDNSKARINLGNIYKNRGQTELAISQYKLVTTLNKNSEIAWFNLGLGYKELENYIESEAAYKQALRLNPESISTRKNLGVIYSKLKKYKEAESVINEALVISPSDTSLLFNLALLYKDIGNIKKSIKQLEILLSLDNTVDKAWTMLGGLYNDLEEYNKAAESYLKVINLDSSNYRAYYNLGKSLYRANEYTKAEKYLLKSLEGIKNDPWIHFTLGKCYKNMGRNDDAEKAFSFTIKLSPQMEKNILNRVLKEDDSTELIIKLLDENPLNHELRRSLIYRLEQDMDYSTALEHIEVFLNTSPNDQEVLTIKANIFSDMNEDKIAINTYIQAYKQNPETFKRPIKLGNLLKSIDRDDDILKFLVPLSKIKPRVNKLIADVYYKKKDFTNSIKFYSIFNEYKQSSESLLDLGKAYYRNRDYRRALEIFLQAENGIENKSWVNTWIARSYRKLDEVKNAQLTYNKVIINYPDFTQAYIGLGDIARDQNDNRLAKQYYNKALEIDPLNRSVKKKIKKVDNL